MSTGAIETWAVNMAELGPLYPWPGSEYVLWIIGMVLWVAFHIIQTRRENRDYEEEVKRFGDAESLKAILTQESDRK